MHRAKIHHTFSAAETQSFAEDFTEKITRGRARSVAFVLALSGDLGAGKTTFTQGFLKGLGIKKRAVSPTFVIFRRYAIGWDKFTNLYHVDAYRLKKGKDLFDLGFKDILKNPQNIVLLEWPEKVKTAMPKNAIKLEFFHGKKENERMIKINPST